MLKAVCLSVCVRICKNDDVRDREGMRNVCVCVRESCNVLRQEDMMITNDEIRVRVYAHKFHCKSRV